MNWTLFAITISFSGLVIPLFIAAGQAAKKELKERLGGWLSNDNTNDIDSTKWSKNFVDFFDELYGKKWYSRKRISRSLISSTIFLLYIHNRIHIFYQREHHSIGF